MITLKELKSEKEKVEKEIVNCEDDDCLYCYGNKERLEALNIGIQAVENELKNRMEEHQAHFDNLYKSCLEEREQIERNAKKEAVENTIKKQTQPQKEMEK